MEKYRSSAAAENARVRQRGRYAFHRKHKPFGKKFCRFFNIVQMLTDKGVAICSLKESFDSTTPQGKFTLSIFAALAELERETIRERQREGINLCLKEGRAYGRPRKQLSKTFANNYADWKAGKIKAVDFMRLESLKSSTFYRLVKEYEGEQNADC